MTTATCEWCGGDARVGTTCPRGITCPTCKAPAGSPCTRPSGHRAAVLHAARIHTAETRDLERERELAAAVPPGQLTIGSVTFAEIA